VGYGSSFTADAPMRIGIVACGYADGYPRHAPPARRCWWTACARGTVGRCLDGHDHRRPGPSPIKSALNSPLPSAARVPMPNARRTFVSGALSLALLSGALLWMGAAAHAADQIQATSAQVPVMTLGARAVGSGLALDGSLQAVRQSVLSAQASGRIAELR
jgi:hypothetical protein